MKRDNSGENGNAINRSRRVDATAVIQAGGLGSRMRELTQDVIPKPMLSMNGKPMLLWQIEKLAEYGICDFVIVIGHLGEKIREYFGNGEHFGVNIDYIEEKEPLGSAGALYYLHKFPAERYLLIYGDVMFDLDIRRLLEFHLKKEALVTLTCHPNGHPHDSDLLEVDSQQRVTKFLWKQEKRTGWFSNLVNAGIFVLEREVLCNIPKPVKTDWEREIVGKLLSTGRVFGYRTSEYMKDAGTPERFRKVSSEQQVGTWEMKNLSKKQRCVFLDRDGTVNRYAGLISLPQQLELYEGVAEAIRLLNESGYLAIIVTNQPVVARGLCSEEDVREIHRKLETLLGAEGAYLDGIAFCPHHPDKGYPEENPAYKIQCNCRKPKIGMIEAMADQYHIDLSESYIIGDTTVDIQTGINAGLHTVLVHTGEGGKDGKYPAVPELEAEDLLAAVRKILSGKVFLF